MKKTSKSVAAKKVVIGNKVRKTVMVAASVKPVAAKAPKPVKEPKVKKAKKMPLEIKAGAVRLSVEFPKTEKFPAVLMPYVKPSWADAPGPFAEIVVKGFKEAKAARLWVTVVKGDNKNGEGILRNPLNEVPIPSGVKVRFGGGTDLKPARLFFDHEGPRATRKIVAPV